MTTQTHSPEENTVGAQARSSGVPLSAAETASVGFARLSFVQLCIVFVAVRLPWMFTIPMGEAPDEFAHYWVIKFLREHWRLPTAIEVHAGGPSAVYGSLPQLGYIPHVAAAALLPCEWLPLAERFGSLAMGLVLLYATCKCARIIFSGKPLLAVALPLTVTLHPQMIFLHSYANCDATSTALSAVLIWLMLDTLGGGLTVRRTAVMGALAGWLALTKYSALAILPVLAISVVSASILHQTALATSLIAVTIASVLAVSISGWWFVRNYHEYQGDVLGTKTMYLTWATTFHRELQYHLSPWRIIKDIRWWRMMFFSFWGLFGYMNKYMWRPTYLTYIGALLASTTGVLSIVYCYLRSWYQRITATNPRASSVPVEIDADLNSKASRISLAMWVCLSLVALINLGSMIWASTQNLGGPQGRYLFNSEIPVLALMLCGLHALPRGDRWVIGFVIFNGLVAAGASIWLCGLYGGMRWSPL